MPGEISLELEGRIRALNELNWSCRRIAKHLTEGRNSVSVATVSRVLRNIGKTREARQLGLVYKHLPRNQKLTNSKLKELDRMSSKPNPLSQENMARKLGVSQTTICVAIKQKLGKRTRVKRQVHALTTENKDNRKKNARKLYNMMSVEQLEFMVTLDEALMFLSSDNHKTNHCYLKFGETLPENCLVSCKESFPKSAMVVGGITGKGVLPLLKLPPNVKINAQNYIDFVLKPYFEEYLPKLYPNEMHKIIFHHDKASSHTANITTLYLQEQQRKYGLSFLSKENIPVKGPDISPLDFYGFGYLKQKAKSCRATTMKGLWKFWNKTWSSVTPEKCLDVFKSWKIRLGWVYKMDGGHIEHIPKIHKRKLR